MNTAQSAEYVAWLEAELVWSYRQIMGDTEDTQEVAGWRAFNGSKRLAEHNDGSPGGHSPECLLAKGSPCICGWSNHSDGTGGGK